MRLLLLARNVGDWWQSDVQMVSTGLEVLGRASASRPDVVRPWIERLLTISLRSRALIALEAVKAIGLRTAHSVLGDVLTDRLEVDGEVEVARELEAVGIPEYTVSLRRSPYASGSPKSRTGNPCFQADPCPPAWDPPLPLS